MAVHTFFGYRAKTSWKFIRTRFAGGNYGRSTITYVRRLSNLQERGRDVTGDKDGRWCRRSTLRHG